MAERSVSGDFPTIVCLCGSTRFPEAFIEANRQETMAGKIVLSVGVFKQSSEAIHGRKIDLTENEVNQLNDLHLRKIDLADEILVLNVFGKRPGEQTRKEIEYARARGKLVRWWNQSDLESATHC